MRRVAIITSLVVVTSSLASAAEERAEPRGFRLAGTAAAATGGVECVAPAAAATLGYHFSRRAGIELEMAYVSRLGPHDSMNHEFRLSSLAPARRLVVATANLRGEMPSRIRWLLPYVVGGVGIANVRTRALTAATDDALAVTAGGGIDFNVFRNMWIDVGVRYQRILASTEDLNVARFGTGVSYRF